MPAPTCFGPSLGSLLKTTYRHSYMFWTYDPLLTLLTPNDTYRRRTAPLTSKVAFYVFIQQI